MTYQNLLYAVDDRIATITLNRPERHNALSLELIDEIIAAAEKADRDTEVRVLVIAGAGGKAFSSGYDIMESAEKPKRTLAEWRVRMPKDIRFTDSVWDCSKPVIATIDGFCFAGAFETATPPCARVRQSQLSLLISGMGNPANEAIKSATTSPSMFTCVRISL
jgi:enoyl-CoA hydratase/carnithine racemase